jgi:hypothetical protein
MLVGHDRDLVAALTHAKHGPHKVLAERAIDPRCAQDGVVWIGLRDSPLAGEFCSTIDAQRLNGVILPIGVIT